MRMWMEKDVARRGGPPLVHPEISARARQTIPGSTAKQKTTPVITSDSRMSVARSGASAPAGLAFDRTAVPLPNRHRDNERRAHPETEDAEGSKYGAVDLRKKSVKSRRLGANEDHRQEHHGQPLPSRQLGVVRLPLIEAQLHHKREEEDRDDLGDDLIEARMRHAFYLRERPRRVAVHF